MPYSLQMNTSIPARRQDRLADFFSGAFAGIPAGVAYLIVEGIDNRISGRRLFDLQLLGRPFVRTPRRATILGAVMHMGNSFALGGLYGLLIEQRLPGPAIVRGLIFVSIENTVLYPVLALERLHPARKSADMGSYWSFRSWLWTMPRHYAFGVVLATIYARLRHRRDQRAERT